jgi:hypothetical protein
MWRQAYNYVKNDHVSSIWMAQFDGKSYIVLLVVALILSNTLNISSLQRSTKEQQFLR